MEYNAGHFENDYQTPLGQELWGWLHSPFNQYRMATAAFLERPPIEALAPYLLDTFGEAVKADRVKQMIGSMVRQMMEASGYQLDRQHVPIPMRRRLLFSSGSRYVRTKNTDIGMTMHMKKRKVQNGD